MNDPENLTDLDADALSRAIHQRELSCREVMQAYLARIGQLNPHVNAIISLAPTDSLLREADARDAELKAGRSRGWMHGMPQAIKDTADATGFPTTLGSAVWRHARPSQDSLFVSRMKAAGCIVIGKTNIPEFGLGSHTFNRLFGPTRNPWDLSVSAGGSSGGAAAALALRMLPVADGSDFMGSLRNPAGWNHVFGLRPSQGRVPSWPKRELYLSQLGTDGPMGRTVKDLSHLLSIQAGHDPRAPLSLSQASSDFVPGATSSLRGVRVGWLGDMGGHLAVDPGILEVCEQALSVMATGGAQVEPLALGFDADQLWQAWLVWRKALVAPVVEAALEQPGAREQLKAEALWEHESAQGLSFHAVYAASVVRSAFLQHLLGLLQRFDVLALPVAQVWPFDVTTAWPQVIAGRPMDTYHRWMECTIYATFAGLPAISMPAGFDSSGRLPMGIQLIGRPQGDADLLRIAAGYESLVPGLLSRRPRVPDPLQGVPSNVAV